MSDIYACFLAKGLHQPNSDYKFKGDFMSNPTIVNSYAYSHLETLFQEKLKSEYSISDAKVEITGSLLTDLNNDGELDDIAGKARLKVGNKYKDFTFFMREDGAIRFRENNGYIFSPEKGFNTPLCFGKVMQCMETLSRPNKRQVRPIDSLTLSIIEYDKSTDGLEVIFPYKGGAFGALNSLELFGN